MNTYYIKILMMEYYLLIVDITKITQLKKAKLLKKETILKAQKSLAARCQDIYDSSMTYMKSPKENAIQNNLKYSSINGNRLLMLHDFFDSPHIYNWMIFPDFWTWTYETLLYCHRNKIILNIKPHPNQRLASKKIVNEFKENFKDSSLLIGCHPPLIIPNF